MHLWNFHVDWTTPAHSTFGTAGAPSSTLPVAPFVRPQCAYGYGPNCAPQKGCPQGLDTLGDRLMFRLAVPRPPRRATTRSCSTTPSSANGANGLRWYEVRVPATRHARDRPAGHVLARPLGLTRLWRWMGSDRRWTGTATSRSASARPPPTDYPSIRYTGRLAGDPAAR